MKVSTGEKVQTCEIPADMTELAEQYRGELLEAVAEEDDEIMMKYLEGEEIGVDEIKAAIRKGTLALHIVPVTAALPTETKAFSSCLMRS